LKNQLILTSAGLITIIVLFFWAKGPLQPATSGKSSTPEGLQIADNHIVTKFNIEAFIASEKSKLSPAHRTDITRLEQEISKTNNPAFKITSLTYLATYWMDSAHTANAYLPAAFYTSEAAKLDNSEKNLTFAGRLFLDLLGRETDVSRLEWESNTAISLFEKAIELDPADDELRLNLGSVYIFGKGKSGGPMETMKGVRQILEVARRDTNNMRAQFLLGVGGLFSGQHEKAISRLQTVIRHEPSNIQAYEVLAEVYLEMGDKSKAIESYQFAKMVSNDQAYQTEVEKRIELIKNSK
jgi:tetratricopeptide (TPR) repeat protein